MNVYDIAMDFVLLDAFNDLDNPPSTIVAVLQNRWITDGMKQSVWLEVWWITELFQPFLLAFLSLFCPLFLLPSPSSLLSPLLSLLPSPSSSLVS